MVSRLEVSGRRSANGVFPVPMTSRRMGQWQRWRESLEDTCISRLLVDSHVSEVVVRVCVAVLGVGL